MIDDIQLQICLRANASRSSMYDRDKFEFRTILMIKQNDFIIDSSEMYRSCPDMIVHTDDRTRKWNEITMKDTERNVIYDMTQIVIQVKDINDNRPTINTTILPPASRDVSFILLMTHGV